MRILSPASRASFAFRLSAFDTGWAILTPALALWIRGAQVLSPTEWPAAVVYCGISFIATLIAFLMFRVRDGMTSLFAVNDAIDVAKAVVVAEFVTCLVLFSTTRLDGVPRSTPLIHALILAAGLIMARAAIRMTAADPPPASASAPDAAEHIIVIGSNRLASLYIEFLRAYAPDRHRIIAILDDRPDMTGRSVAGVRVLGPTLDLVPVISEFKEHGVVTDRIIVAGDADMLSAETAADIRRLCAEGAIRLDFVPRLLGLNGRPAPAPDSAAVPAAVTAAAAAARPYFRIKRIIDLCLVSLLIVILMPVLMTVALIVLLDVGSPVLFWQRRIGMNGRPFQMQKFRTLKPSFDWRGMPIAATERASWVGRLLRQVHLDELPQLLNVLVGDMSLIGPRPLLPHDQPANPDIRLTVRPGITGLAQVCGGTLLSPSEKNEFDEIYVQRASLPLDLMIVARTLKVVLFGHRRAARSAAGDHEQAAIHAPSIAPGKAREA